MTEDQLEQETLGWLAELGYAVHSGYDIAHDGPNPQRATYRQVLLPFRLREAIQRLNPSIPTAAREDALQRVLDLGIPALLSANRAFHKLLVAGVPVLYQKDGETIGDFVRLVDWAQPERNEWWTRRGVDYTLVLNTQGECIAHDSELGNAPAHALFERLKITPRAADQVARSFDAYNVAFDGEGLAVGAEVQAAPGVTLQRIC